MSFADGYRDYASDVEMVKSVEAIIFALKKRNIKEFGLIAEEWEWISKLEECMDSMNDFVEATYD